MKSDTEIRRKQREIQQQIDMCRKALRWGGGSYNAYRVVGRMRELEGAKEAFRWMLR